MRIVIADDSMLVREGVARVLEAAGHEVVGFAANGEELIGLVRTAHPDVAIVDIRMPPTNTDDGVRAAASLRAEHGQRVGILILSQYVEPAYAQQVLTEMAEGSGYLLKDRVADPSTLADAVTRVAAGEMVVDPEIVAQLLRKRERDPLSDLTMRELDVLALVAEGRSNQAIADQLSVAPKTVETHVNAIFSKLALEPAAEDNRRVLAVLTYLRGRMLTR